MRLKRVSKNVKANAHRPKPEMIYKDVECALNASLKEVKNLGPTKAATEKTKNIIP